MLRTWQNITMLAGATIGILATVFALSAPPPSGSVWTHTPSVVFVIFVNIGISLISFQINNFIDLVGLLFKDSPVKNELMFREIKKRMKYLCDAYYSQGGKGVARSMTGLMLPKIWQKMISLLESKVPEQDILMLIEQEEAQVEESINEKIAILTSMSQISPSIGVIGTVMGLIKMLQGITDMTSLGSNMALALVTTLYGLFMSVFVFNPLAARLTNIRNSYRKIYEQASFWSQLIAGKKPSIYCDDSLEKRSA